VSSHAALAPSPHQYISPLLLLLLLLMTELMIMV
jgi:hypothetical protein